MSSGLFIIMYFVNVFGFFICTSQYALQVTIFCNSKTLSRSLPIESTFICRASLFLLFAYSFRYSQSVKMSLRIFNAQYSCIICSIPLIWNISILSARSMRALIHLAFYSSCLVGPFPQFCAFHYKYLSLSVCKCQVVSLTCL